MLITFFHSSVYSGKYDLIPWTTHDWQTCISQFNDKPKGMILQNFSQTKKRDYYLVAVSSLTQSEKLTTATRLPILIYSMIVLDSNFILFIG